MIVKMAMGDCNGSLLDILRLPDPVMITQLRAMELGV
jgi:hypothetical protein